MYYLLLLIWDVTLTSLPSASGKVWFHRNQLALQRLISQEVSCPISKCLASKSKVRVRFPVQVTLYYSFLKFIFPRIFPGPSSCAGKCLRSSVTVGDDVASVFQDSSKFRTYLPLFSAFATVFLCMHFQLYWRPTSLCHNCRLLVADWQIRWSLAVKHEYLFISAWCL